MKIKRVIISVCLVFIAVVLFSWQNKKSEQDLINKDELWTVNPVDISVKYFENLGNNNRFEYVVSDIDTNYKMQSESDGYFNLDNKQMIDESNKRFKDSVEGVKIVSVLPSKYQENVQNPIKIKTKNGKIETFINPIVVDVTFNVEYKNKESILAYEDGLNTKTITLVNYNGKLKIITITD